MPLFSKASQPNSGVRKSKFIAKIFPAPQQSVRRCSRFLGQCHGVREYCVYVYDALHSAVHVFEVESDRLIHMPSGPCSSSIMDSVD